MSESALRALARNQHGLVSRAQALSLISPKQVERRLSDGRLELVRRRVYRIGGTPETWEQHLLAACLAVPDAIASFSSAAALFGLAHAPERRLEVTVPRRHPVRHGGLVVHDTTTLAPSHVIVVRAIPATSVARTLYDLSAVVTPWRLEQSVDDALRRRLVSLPDLVRVAELLDGQGRRRCTVMRAILADRRSEFDPGDSHPEARIVRLLVAAGLPRPVQQHRVQLGRRSVRIDLAYPAQGIAIEYDGWDFHSSRSAFDADRARANDLVLLGLTLLRFTSKSSDDQIVETVRGALQRASVG